MRDHRKFSVVSACFTAERSGSAKQCSLADLLYLSCASCMCKIAAVDEVGVDCWKSKTLNLSLWSPHSTVCLINCSYPFLYCQILLHLQQQAVVALLTCLL